MKKLFTLIAVAAMALSANAQQVIDYTTMKDGDFTVANATVNATESKEGKKVYDIKGGDELQFTKNDATNVIFTITNSGNKAKIFVVNFNAGENTDKASVEFGGKNGIVVFNDAKVGDVIRMNVAAKGGTAAQIVVLSSEGTETIESTRMTLPKKDKNAEGADAEGYVWKEFTFTVTENMLKTIEGVKVVRVKETEAGYRCKAVAINADLPSSVETLKAAKAAQNGATYNVAGQQVDAAAKGLVIKNGKKVVIK